MEIEMLESDFKKYFIDSIKARFAAFDLDFINTKPHNRSIPDLIILGPNVWAALEFKKSKRAKRQPNQKYHVDRMNGKGFARFVYPSNASEVLHDLERLFISEW